MPAMYMKQHPAFSHVMSCHDPILVLSRDFARTQLQYCSLMLGFSDPPLPALFLEKTLNYTAEELHNDTGCYRRE